MFLPIQLLIILGLFFAQLGFAYEGNIQQNLVVSEDNPRIVANILFRCRNCGGPLPPSLPAGSKNICPNCGTEN